MGRYGRQVVYQFKYMVLYHSQILFHVIKVVGLFSETGISEKRERRVRETGRKRET